MSTYKFNLSKSPEHMYSTAMLDRTLQIFANRKVTIIVSWILVGILSIDLLSSRQTTLQFDANLETVYFVLTVVIGWGIGSWLFLGYISKATAHFRAKSKLLTFMHVTVTLIQFSLLIFFVSVMLNRNYEFLTWNANIITSVIATTILGAFSIKFFSWYRRNSKNFVILFYGLATAMLTIVIATDLGAKQFLIEIVQEKSLPGTIPAEKYLLGVTDQGRIIKKDIGYETTTTYIVPTASIPAYQWLHQIPPPLAYMFTWAAVALTFRHYRKKMGNLTFWFLISIIPSLYILGDASNIFPDFMFDDLVPQTKIMNYIYRAATIGGNIMFGIAFFALANRIAPIRDYLFIAAIGLATIGIEHETMALQQTFGVAAHSLLMLSTYLFTIGLYASAISISQDARLRQIIKRSAKDELLLLGGMGEGQVKQEIERKVMSIVKSQYAVLVQETGVRPSIEDSDITQYLEQVTKEIKGSKTGT
jgi:hypothetical protein